MKKNLLRTGVMAMLAAAAAFGQGVTLVKMTVPFAFVAGDQAWPAGRYSIQRVSDLSADLVIGSDSARRVAILSLQQPLYSDADRDLCSLVFHRYGNKYFLSEVWGSGSGAVGRKLRMTKRERETASLAAASARVVLAAR